MNLPGNPLTQADFLKLAASGITRDIAEQAQLRRVVSLEGSELVGRNGSGDYAGIIFPYFAPGEQHIREIRLRRDHPEFEQKSDGSRKEKNKYMSPPGRGNMLYYPPGTDPAWLTDTSISAIITEGEKKTLGLWRLAWHQSEGRPRFVPIGLSGVWNFRGTVGKTQGPNGERCDVKGVIPDIERIAWKDRRVCILFDANPNEKVLFARATLTKELQQRGANVQHIDLPDEPGVNGVDDLIGLWGPERVLAEVISTSHAPLRGKKSSGSSIIDAAGLICSHNGEPKALLANAITLLRTAPEWKGVLAFNEFSLGTAALKPAPWGGVRGEWTDLEDRLTANWLQHRRVFVSVDIAGQAVQTVANDQRFHPVREYLDGLKWDGTKRLHSWMSLYLGADASDYTGAVGSRWMISAVARIYSPGTKADCCLILEGPQGIGKSTSLKTIAGNWFADEVAELGSKDAAMQTRGVWIIEIAELDSMSRAEVSKIKSFMSRSTDRFRPPYGKRLIESPRQCVFAGSVNHSTYLRDETGARRFWPVACSRILIDDLAQDRDQLWAEAVHQFRTGAPWWLETRELNQAAQQEQSDRYEGDPWDELISTWAEARDSVSIEQVLTLCLEKDKAQWTQSDKNRIARCLSSMGWERYKGPREGPEQAREWRYRRVGSQ